MDLHNNNEIIENRIDAAPSDKAASENYNSDKQFAPKTKKRIIFIMGLICGLLISGVAGKFLHVGRFVTNDAYEYYRGLEDNFGKYNEILRMIGEDPIAKEQPEAVTDEMLKELVAGIGDPYAEYMTAEEYVQFLKTYSDEYVGIGVQIHDEDGKVVIVNVFDDSPAQDAGLNVGDVVLKVDGVVPKNSTDAVSRITGEEGTEVEVLIVRGEEELTFKMNRAKIEYDSVEYSVTDDSKKIGVIRILGFRNNTANDFKLAVRDLKNMGCEKYIIDLRDNGGGLTSESIEIADYLLPAGRIMSENTKDGTETVHNSKASSADIEYVVLTNKNTASASEILAGAIQDNKGGLIIGEKTFGKGVTQITKKFSDGTAIKLTITEYFRPNGETVHEKGITPDIEVPSEEAEDRALEELLK